jgi:cbb3-type cytochrome oxidase maturation protein
MFYIAWLTLIAVGVGVSIIVFIWALKTGQFADQTRARYLPLTDDAAAPSLAQPQRLPSEVYVLMVILVMGLISIASTITLTIYWLQK